MYEKEVCLKNSNLHFWEDNMIYVYHKKMNDVWYSAAIEDNKVMATFFSVKEPDLDRLLRRLPQDTHFQIVEDPTKQLSEILLTLEEIFEGKDKENYGFEIALDHLSSYTQEVLNCTSLVPVGYVTTYMAIAKIAGGIARSVGRIEATNPFALLIPCHRVVCSDLRLGGYVNGEQVKKEILQKEDRGYQEAQKIKINRDELPLFPVKRIK
jgi:methylated-DNA-[protein]-cysteine S-methyltransferase